MIFSTIVPNQSSRPHPIDSIDAFKCFQGEHTLKVN